MQAANGTDNDYPIVIISTMRIDQIQLIDNAKQIIGLVGSTLFGLEDTLAEYERVREIDSDTPSRYNNDYPRRLHEVSTGKLALFALTYRHLP